MGDPRVKGPSLPPGRGSWGRRGGAWLKPPEAVAREPAPFRDAAWRGRHLMLRTLADAAPGAPIASISCRPQTGSNLATAKTEAPFPGPVQGVQAT